MAKKETKKQVLNRIYKRKPERYLLFDRTIINNPVLSLKAKGMQSILLDQADGWQFYENELVKRSSDGRTSVASALRELEENRYLLRVWIRERGRFAGRIWVVFEEPPTPEEYEKEKREIERMLTESQSIGISTGIRFSDIGNSDIGKHAANENNNNENNNNENNNNENNNNIVVVEIFNKFLIDIKPVLLKYPAINILNEDELYKIAKTLSDKKAEGKITNPVGLLLSNPEKTINAVLKNEFYPSMKKKVNNKSRLASYTPEYDIYVPPEM